MKNLNYPIFIHSLFRSGSTYFYSKVRDIKGFCCLQEPLHEFVFQNVDTPVNLITSHGPSAQQTYRHPQLDLPYWQEVYDLHHAWKDHCDQNIIYGQYFERDPEKLNVSFWKSLIQSTSMRLVFQECRTASRMGALKVLIPAFHIFLKRNPRDQWKSYGVTRYFHSVNLILAHLPNAPSSISKKLYRNLNIKKNSNLKELLSQAKDVQLSDHDSYWIFYNIWRDAYETARSNADLIIDMDILGQCDTYRLGVQMKLKDFGIPNINFDDCNLPSYAHDSRHLSMFEEIELQVESEYDSVLANI